MESFHQLPQVYPRLTTYTRSANKDNGKRCVIEQLEDPMSQKKLISLAKKVLSEKMGVMVQKLEYLFNWEYEGDEFFTFRINQADHRHYGSTQSINVSQIR